MPVKSREYDKEYYSAHREEQIARTRAYYLAHREELLAKAKDPEVRARKREANRHWRERNPEATRLAQREYQAAHYARRMAQSTGALVPCQGYPEIGTAVQLRYQPHLRISGDGAAGTVKEIDAGLVIVALAKPIKVDGEIWYEIGCQPSELLRRVSE